MFATDNLEAAYVEGEKNPVWQSLWEPNDQQIQQIVEANLIPEKDARSGGRCFYDGYP